MYYIYEKSIDQEDWQAIEVCRTENEKRAFEIKNRRIRNGIEIIIYKDDAEIWRGMGV